MVRTLDMKFIRYLNLFEKITKVRTQHCFIYNSVIIFVVPGKILGKAIGEHGANTKKMSSIIGKKVRVISEAEGKEKEDIEKFVLAIVHPVRFNNLEFNDAEKKVVINGGRQSKAALIGRNKLRLAEMQKILEDYFNIREIRIA